MYPNLRAFLEKYGLAIPHPKSLSLKRGTCSTSLKICQNLPPLSFRRGAGGEVVYGLSILLVLLFVIFFVLSLLSPLSYGGADDIVHYRFAKYSFKYPELLLDHWAKPVFTLLASPFAQLGYWGVKLFNLLVGVLTGYLLFCVANILKIKRSQWIVLFLFFTPVYTTMLMSGMTEILFSAVLVLAAFLFLRSKYVWSAVVISFLPLIRTEGIVIWPIYIIAFVVNKKWKAIPFILSASIVYSIVGGLYFKDFLWLITHIPYTGTYDIYGHGELLHFVKSNKVVFGIPLTLLFAAGIIGYFIQYKKEVNKEWLFPSSRLNEILLIIAPLLAFYCAHSYVWWKGINSLGLIRVMACVAPLFVICSLRGLNLILDIIPIRFIRGIILLSLLYIIIITPFKVYEIPLKLSPKDQVVKQAAEWFKTSPYHNRKYYIWDSYFYFTLGTNPYDQTKMSDAIPDKLNPENRVSPGDIVIWDAHFSAVDGRFPLTSIIDNSYYKLVKVFRPRSPFIAGGGTYQICFFERLDSAMKFDNRRILDSLVAIKPSYEEVSLLTRSFTEPTHPEGLEITSQQQYYPLKEMQVEKQTWHDGDELSIAITSRGQQMLLAVSVGNSRKVSFYEAFPFNSDTTTTLEHNIILPGVSKKNQTLKVYIWNRDKHTAHIHQVDIKLRKQ